MSGGHWDYCQFKLEDCLQEVSKDGKVIRRFPKLAQVLGDMAIILGKAIHDLDWDLSGNSEIKDDLAFEEGIILSLGTTLTKKLTFRVYEVKEE